MTTERKLRIPASASGLSLSQQSLVDAAPLMTAKHVGEYLQLPPKKVYEVVGSLALSIGQRRLRWRKADIDAWLENQRRNR